LTVIVRPPGLTTSVLDDDSRSTIVTWTVVVCPADSERTLRLMAKLSGSRVLDLDPGDGPALSRSPLSRPAAMMNVSWTTSAASAGSTSRLRQ